MKNRLFIALLITAAILAATALAQDDPAEAPPDADAASGASTYPADVTPLPQQFQVGLAKVDMTPDPEQREVRLGGYGGRGKEPATGVLDPVYARALVGRDAQGELFGIVALDICHISSDLREKVIEEVAPLGFTEDNLLVTATHSHSSMHIDRVFVARLIFGPFDQELFDQTVSRAAQAVILARESMQPARLEIAHDNIRGMNRSRLDPAFDVDSSSMTNGLHPDPEKYPVNERMTVIRISTPEGGPLGALVHFTAHPTILSPDSLLISAEFPGVVCGRIERELGHDTTAIFLNGTLGDTAPTPDWTGDVEVEIGLMHDYGNKLADYAIETLARVQPMDDLNVAANQARYEFQKVTIRSLWWAKLPTGPFMLRPDVPFQVVRLGNLVLMAVPGEPTTSVGLDLKSLCPDECYCMIVPLANSHIGYIVSQDEYEGGTYAASACMFGPDTALKVKQAMAAAVEPIR